MSDTAVLIAIYTCICILLGISIGFGVSSILFYIQSVRMNNKLLDVLETLNIPNIPNIPER